MYNADSFGNSFTDSFCEFVSIEKSVRYAIIKESRINTEYIKRKPSHIEHE